MIDTGDRSLSGVIQAVVPNVIEFKNGDEIYGLTNPQFCGADDECALAFANTCDTLRARRKKADPFV
jgi:hypothetical protein